MAQANNLNNTSSRWWSLAQTLVWIIRRIEMLPRDAEQIANSPEMNHKIERALNELKGEFWRAVLGMTEGMPIDMFRILCGRRYVDLLTLIQLPSGEEPGAMSAAMHQLQRDIRWQDVECNSDWLKRAFPAPAPASVPVTNTESSVAEPEAASVNAMTAVAESSPEPAALTADEDPTNPEPSLANRGGRPPKWDFAGVIPLLKTRKAENKPFKDMAAFKNYIQKKVQRVDGLNRDDGPDPTTVERAITKYCLDEYATFQK
jgi:hypothetical protein